MIDVELFQQVFGALLEAKGKRDQNGILTQLYFDAIAPTKPTQDEIWEAIAAFIDHSGPLPSAGEIKQFIWDKRKRDVPALPAGAEPLQRVRLSPQEARRNRVSFLIGIYKAGGDRPFYRKMLDSNAGLWSKFAGEITGDAGLVTYEEVLAAIALQEVA